MASAGPSAKPAWTAAAIGGAVGQGGGGIEQRAEPVVGAETRGGQHLAVLLEHIGQEGLARHGRR